MDINPALATESVIDAFGGIQPMAEKLETPVSTVRGWKKRGFIPQARHDDIKAAAARDSIALDPLTLAATDPVGGMPGEEPLGGAPLLVQPGPAPIVARRGNAGGVLALVVSLLTIAAVVAASIAAWWFYLQPLNARVAALEARAASNPAIEQLRARLDRLEALPARPADRPASGATADNPAQTATTEPERLSAVEKQVAEIRASATEFSQLLKRLSDLQMAAGSRELLTQSIIDIQSSTAATQGSVERLSGQLAALTGRVDKVDLALAQRRQQSMRAEAVMLSVEELRAALRTDQPFAKQIIAVRALIGADQEISELLDQLQPYADDGVPSVDDLRTEFGHLAPNIVRSAVVGDGASWWRQTLYHIESVISVRRVGDAVKGDATDAVVARAEQKLEEDDLKGAASALQPLTGLSAQVAQPWLHEAHDRVALDDAADALTSLSIKRVSNGNAQPPASPQSSPGQPGGFQTQAPQ